MGKNIKYGYTKIVNLDAGKRLADNLSNLYNNDLNVIVYNFVDMLSHARTEMEVLKELADFDFSAIPQLNKQRVLDLARGEYINKAEPIILVGQPGLGKSHVASGLALAACRQCHRVRFYNAAALVNELSLAREQQRLPKFLATALRQQLIVLDELGFIPFSTTDAQLMFQFCSTLHERVALIITTNLKFADWTQVFGSEQLTAALLDRLTFKAHILEFIGESFRFRQRMQQQDQSA